MGLAFALAAALAGTALADPAAAQARLLAGEAPALPVGKPAFREFYAGTKPFDLASQRTPGVFAATLVTSPGARRDRVRRDRLRNLVGARKDLAGLVVVVEGADGGLAAPAARALGATSLPYSVVHGPDGQLVAAGSEADSLLRRLERQAHKAGHHADFIEVETGGQVVDLWSRSHAGKFTGMVFVSRHHPSHDLLRPYLLELARDRANTQVLWVGTDAPGATTPDPQAPILQEWGAQGVPWFLVFDQQRRLVAEGDAAWVMLSQEMLSVAPDMGGARGGGFTRLGATTDPRVAPANGRFTFSYLCAEGVEACEVHQGLFRHLAKSRPQVQVREIDLTPAIVDGNPFEVPVAKQVGAQRLPWILLHGPDGRAIAEGKAAYEIAKNEFQYLRPPAKGEGPVPPDEVKGATATITWGNPVDLEKYLVPGKTTIFDFYSYFCGPCRQITPRLEHMAAQRDDVVVRVVNVNRPGVMGIDGRSPVAMQHRVFSFPSFFIYGPDKRLLASGRAGYQAVLQMLGS